MSFSNHAVFLAIHNLSGRNGFADAIGIFLAEWMPYLLAIAFLALVFMQPGARKKFYLFAEGALAVILARGIVTPLIQLFYHEPRPFSFYGFAPLIGESGWSFPSAHAALFFALLIPVWYANKKWGWWYLAAAALMAVARVYAGVHWPLDIVAGAIIGMRILSKSQNSSSIADALANPQATKLIAGGGARLYFLKGREKHSAAVSARKFRD